MNNEIEHVEFTQHWKKDGSGVKYFKLQAGIDKWNPGDEFFCDSELSWKSVDEALVGITIRSVKARRKLTPASEFNCKYTPDPSFPIDVLKSESADPPIYYSGWQVGDFISSQGLNFNRGNIIKYISRAGKKEGESELSDLKKALDYLLHEIELVEKISS